jgi:glycosyltransferase involved in cell wall biosynthesis
MKKHTILHTIDSGGPGGAETVLLTLATRLDPARFRSLVLLPPGPWLNEKLREHQVPIFEVGWKNWHDFRGPLAMARIVKQEKVDLIHSHLPGQNFYSCVVGDLTGCKTLVTYHGAVEFNDATRMRRAFMLWYVRKSADGVIVVCDYVRNMMKAMGFPLEALHRIYNGIDPRPFAVPETRRLHDELQLAKDIKFVGVIANVRRSKGYDYFVRAARMVADRVSGVRFLAVGDVNEEVAAPIVHLVEELHLKDKFHFLGFRHDVPQVLAELDVFVLSSTSEGFPLATLEAMAAGKPMVVTDCGGPREVVDDGVTGYLVPPADANALAQKIIALLEDSSKARALGSNARAKVLSQFTLDTMVKEYEKLYEAQLA